MSNCPYCHKHEFFKCTCCPICKGQCVGGHLMEKMKAAELKAISLQHKYLPEKDWAKIW